MSLRKNNLRKSLSMLIGSLLIAIFVNVQPLLNASAIGFSNFGGNSYVEKGANAARSPEQPTDLLGAGNGVFGQITSILLFVIGVLSVIMLIVGGLKYVVSGGNKDKVASAKNTILYAIIGLVVAILAYAAINFIISTFTKGGENYVQTSV